MNKIFKEKSCSLPKAIFLFCFCLVTTSCKQQKCENVFFKLLNEGAIRQIEQCVDKGYNVNSVDSLGQTPLLVAVTLGDLSLIKFLVERGGNSFIMSPDGLSLTKWAKKYEHLSLIPQLKQIQFEQWLGIENRFENEYLTAGIEQDNELIIRRFLEKKEDLNKDIDSGLTPITLAVFQESTEIVKLLLEHGISPDSEFDTRSILSMAAMFGYYDIVEVVLDHDADIDNYDGSHTTALMFAAENGYLEIVKLLISLGADTSLRDKSGITALDKALANKYDSVAHAIEGRK